MNRLSEQERAGLEEVFLAISSTKKSRFQENISHCHAHYLYIMQQRLRVLKGFIYPLLQLKITPKTTTTHKNSEK